MAKKAKASPKKGAAKPKVAAKKPNGKKASTAATAADVMAVPSKKAFNDLLDILKGHEADKNESVGAIGSAISHAVDKDHFDKKALGIFRGLNRMSDRKLAITLAHVFHYINIGGLQARADKQAQMFDANPPDVDGEGEDDGDGQTDIEDAAPSASNEFQQAADFEAGGRPH